MSLRKHSSQADSWQCIPHASMVYDHLTALANTHSCAINDQLSMLKIDNTEQVMTQQHFIC